MSKCKLIFNVWVLLISISIKYCEVRCNPHGDERIVAWNKEFFPLQNRIEDSTHVRNSLEFLKNCLYHQ